MDRSLDSLSSEFQPLAFELLARLVGRGIMVMIVQTSRTEAEHLQNVANGTSSTRASKHLPRKLRQFLVLSHPNPDMEKCDAMDLCPYETWEAHGPDKLQWDESKNPQAWAAIGEEAEKLGLRWGGRWHKPHDPGHVEWLFPGERYADIPQTSIAWRDHGAINESGIGNG